MPAASVLRMLLLLLLACFAPRGSVGAQQRTLDATEVARQGRDAHQKGDKKLARGFASLALHIDPFLPHESQELGAWMRKVTHSETRQYWRGSAFVGHDKTHLESIMPKEHLFAKGQIHSLLLFAWRNLQLTGLSCCGMDNVAVFFQQANKHMYLVPFMHLVPGAADRLKPENVNMYKSFREWWESTGRRPMPDPAVAYHGDGKFEWEIAKVALKPSRMPKGWPELIEAVLAHRVEQHEGARLCLQAALKKNKELRQVASNLLPALKDVPVPTLAATTPAARRKYVVCYNPHVGLGNLAVVMVSAHMLAKLTGRTLLLHWNVNTVSSDAFKLREGSGVQLLPDWAASEEEEVVFSGAVKHIYFFHMMNSEKLGETLELLGCSDFEQSLSHDVVSVSSNLFFAPLLRVNPHTPQGAVPDFPELLQDLLRPSDLSAKRARTFIKANDWGKDVPVIAIHIRAREAAEDNDDWPTADAPAKDLLEKLRLCLETALAKELSSADQYDVYIASTTEAARAAVAQTLRSKAFGLRRVLEYKPLLDRRSTQGAEDAMTEALLMSRADVFVRMVVGTSGFSTFAYLTNALRRQNDWVADMPSMQRSGFAPNYLITDDCGPGRCFSSPPDVRMASIAWHGKQYTQRSCGDVVQKVERRGTASLGCRGLRPLDGNGRAGDEL